MQVKIDPIDHLREKIKKDYPALENCEKSISMKSERKMKKNLGFAVRPTFSSSELNVMLKNSSKFVSVKNVKFPSTPKNKPIFVNAQEWEAVTSLNCFFKHISPRSFQKYISENVPGFEKGRIKRVKFPGIERKKPARVRGISLNEANLEFLGLKETTLNPGVHKKNLSSTAKRIDSDLRKWCIGLAKKPDAAGQLIDYRTQKIKSLNTLKLNK